MHRPILWRAAGNRGYGAPDRDPCAVGRVVAGCHRLGHSGARLGNRDLPDPDLIIRTSGELRLSNFLLWQAAYAELYFDPVQWPDYSVEHLATALRSFANRERRFGGLKAQTAL